MLTYCIIPNIQNISFIIGLILPIIKVFEKFSQHSNFKIVLVICYIHDIARYPFNYWSCHSVLYEKHLSFWPSKVPRFIEYIPGRISSEELHPEGKRLNSVRSKQFISKKKNPYACIYKISSTIFANSHYIHSERIFVRLICFRVKVTIVIVALRCSSPPRPANWEHVTSL